MSLDAILFLAPGAVLLIAIAAEIASLRSWRP